MKNVTKRKRFLAFIVMVLLLLNVVGCGKSTETTEKVDDKETTATTEQSTTTEATATDTTTTTEEVKAVEKPEKITMMVNGTLFTQENGRDAFEARWEELTGVDLEIIQPDHAAYLDSVGQTFASGELPDVILLDPNLYAGFAQEGILWDMTDAYANSKLKASGRVTDETIIDSLRIDDKLYGLTPARGNGCITYIKKAWLDNVGLNAPTNYDEYNQMLDAFTNQDPDGNGVNGDTYGVAAAGFVGPEVPFINYLPEFYQDAFPSFYQKADGTWADGFTEDSMISAMERLKAAYDAGYIDKETLTNGTSDCRNKYYEDKFGVFTYWAGNWGTSLKLNLEANGKDGELIALEPISEVGTYIERQTGAWSITASCENPEGVFEYFFETMMDGGDMQLLWTYGVEDVHWSTKAGTVLEKTFEEGVFHMLESLEKPGTVYTKNHIDPMLSIVAFEGEDLGAATVRPEALVSQTTFNSNSHIIGLVPSSDEMSQYNGDLVNLKREIVANVITQGASIEDEMKRFVDEGGAEWSQLIVDSLNK